MKRFVLLLVIIAAAFSCRQGNTVDEPENFIEEEKMADMLYDLTLLQTIYSVAPDGLQDKRIDGYNFLKGKYGVDSTTFSQNHKYYAAQPEKYQKMQKRIIERLDAEKKKLEKVEPSTAAEKQLEKGRPTQ
ncbi:MAG: DUF4296 domain-containing protein [Flavobacterium sp.]